MRRKLFIVTGARRGFGKSLADRILAEGDHLVSISRPLEKRSQVGRNNFESIDTENGFFEIFCDLSKWDQYEEDVETQLQALVQKKYEQIYLINNAAVVEPVSPIGQLSSENVRIAVDVNLISPILLTQTIVKIFSSKFLDSPSSQLTVVNISSGAASNPIPSWSIYCGTKAGLKMATEVFAEDFKHSHQFRWINFSPGIMNTDMQATIRSQKKETFPWVGKFQDFKSSNQLNNPDMVAEKLLNFLKNDPFLGLKNLDIKDL